MKNLTTLLLLLLSISVNAQLLKRLKAKVSEKINNVVDQKIDKTIDDAIYGKKDTSTSTPVNNTEDKSIGFCNIEHNNSFGNVNITEFGKVKSQLGYQRLEISGPWVTVAFDVADSFYLVIKDINAPIDDVSYFSGKTYVLYESEEEIKGNGAYLSMAYNPEKNNSPNAPYQAYILKNGEVNIQNINENQVEFSANGTPKDKYDSSKKIASSVKINVEVSNTKTTYLDNAPKKKTVDKGYVPNLEDYGIRTSESIDKTYTFNTQIDFEMTDNEETINQSFWQSNENHYAMFMNTEDGKMIFIFDEDKQISLLENNGQKIQLPSVANNQSYKDQISSRFNHESGLLKTGKSKKILGYTCYEYSTNNNETILWITKELDLHQSMLTSPYGTILETHYSDHNQQYNIKAVKIHKLNKSINTNEYKQMMSF